MVAESRGRRWSVEDYLWLERNSPVKHEFVTATFAEYRTIAAFREYILAAADRVAVHVYQGQGAGDWTPTSYAAGDEILLESLGVRLPVDALYHKVRLRPALAR